MADAERKQQYDAWFSERAQKVRDISLKEKTMTIQGIAQSLQSGDLNLTPDYQRGFVWKEKRSARLIETVLGGRFIPPVVLHEKSTGCMDVIDGKQRLSTILSFLLGEHEGKRYGLPETAASLNPENSDDGEEHPLRGLCFEDLPNSEKRRFRNFGVDVKIVPRDADEDLVFDIYEDINSGADDLTAHQLRRAAFSGAYMRLVDRLRKNRDLLAIRGATGVDDKKESDGEMVLRAFAFSNSKPSDYKGPLKKFLNRDASAMNRRLAAEASAGAGAGGAGAGSEADGCPTLRRMEEDFCKVTSIMVDVFGAAQACREWDGKRWDARLSLWLWDGLYAVLKEAVCDNREVTAVGLQRRAGDIVAALKRRFEDGSFDQARGMTRPQMTRRRDVLRRVILTAGAAADAAPLPPGASAAAAPADGGADDDAYGGVVGAVRRLFDREPTWLQELWEKQEGRCGVCGQEIHEEAVLDGARTHVDHVVPHAAGGLTEPGNAQLVHARCNQSKGARPAGGLAAPPPEIKG